MLRHLANQGKGAALKTGLLHIREIGRDLGVEAVITGHVGPKAFATLRAGNVTIYTGASGTVAEALKQFEAGALEEAGDADVEGHWV